MMDNNGRTNVEIIFLMIAFAVLCILFSVIGFAGLNCSIMPSGDCGETIVLYLENDTGGYWNAHAENVSEASYAYAVCCDANEEGATLSTDCDDVTFLRLSSLSNAHVEVPNQSSYNVGVCMSADTKDISCNYPETTCSSGYSCLASVSNITNAHIGNCSEYGTQICCGFGSAPSNPTPRMNSSDPALNRTAQELECSFIPEDNEGGTLYADITWVKDGIVNTTNASISVTDGGQFVDILDSDYTSKYEKWSCLVTICDDSSLCSSEVSSPNLTILNTPPGIPTLSSPANDTTTNDRTPAFEWNAVSADADGDPITYELNVNCEPACSAGNKQVSDISGITHTLSGDLDYFWDDGDYYDWYVRAYDGDEHGANSDYRTFYLQSQVVLTMLDDSINFGSMNIGDNDDTSDDNPAPFSIQNDGNCHIDVNISSDNLLWDTQASPSSYFRYKADNYSSEEDAFNWTGSVTSWTNIPVTNNTMISWFNHSDLTDAAEIDILVDVPLDEPSGNKNSLIQFTGHYVKIT